MTSLVATIPSSREWSEGDLFVIRMHNTPPFVNVSLGTVRVLVGKVKMVGAAP